MPRAFAVVLTVLAAIPQMPVMPWGVASLAVAVVLVLHLFWTSGWQSHWDILTKCFFSIMFVAVVCIVAYTLMKGKWITEKSQTMQGDLVAPDDGKDHYAENPVFQVGPTGETKLRWIGPIDVPLIAMNYDKLEIHRVNGRLELSTTVRDSNKTLIVTITKNHWEVSPIKSVCWDHNYTSNSLEVLDGRRQGCTPSHHASFDDCIPGGMVLEPRYSQAERNDASWKVRRYIRYKANVFVSKPSTLGAARSSAIIRTFQASFGEIVL